MKRKGSALLIVLGMMAFIVVSAVAFAAYMRYSRMPSSYLRRTSASRMLVKAALANAIDIIDESIGNSAYPGQTGINQKSYRHISDDENARNSVTDYWTSRCFIGSNALVSTESTVSTLCTEALAYLPPSIINDVRYYSRRSVAGSWHAMSFDAGRYAFCAVDVSDFIDINSVRCLTLDAQGQELYGRNCSDEGRVTLAHCFENASHSGYQYAPSDWDEFMDQFIENKTKVPIVSMADLNLAMNKNGMSETMSPFCRFINNGTPFVQNDNENDPQTMLLRNMNFVSDSMTILTNRMSDSINLAGHTDQPFGTGYTLSSHDDNKKNDDTLEKILNGVGIKFEKWLDKKNSPFFNSPESVQLYDYMDKDSVPLSLAMPTVERTPMITGVALDSRLMLVAETQTSPEQRTANPGTPGVDFAFTKSTTTLKMNGILSVSAGFVFPFKYLRGSEGTYKAQAAMTLTFVPNGHTKLRRDNAKTVVQWSNSKKQPEVITGNDAPTYVTALSDLTALSLPSDGEINSKGEKGTIIDDVKFDFQFSNVSFAQKIDGVANSPFSGADTCAFRVIHKYPLKYDTVSQQVVVDKSSEAQGFPQRKLGWLPANEALAASISENDVLSGGQKYYPVIQVWVRVIDAQNKTVDLSPAYYKDDTLTGGSAVSNPGLVPTSMKERPLLRFYPEQIENAAVTYDSQNDKLAIGAAGNQADLSAMLPKGYMADDPRFNYAPENMQAISDDEKFSEIWLTAAQGSASARDGDIFMACSDAGYLQSAYELTYLLRVSGSGNDYWGVIDGSGYDGNAASSFNDMPAKGAMWRTYSQYPCDGRSGDIDNLDIISGARGFRVNPFAQSKDILLTALANPPVDWWAASTNALNDSAKQSAMASASAAAKFQFTKMSGGKYQMDPDDIEDFAEKFMSTMRASGSGSVNWRSRFDSMGWDDGDEDQICGQTFRGLKFHSVDRKFLHGFWKECFDNRQQLFLIFVRAEPMMMGGGGMGQTPPQLGARAMAVVWRDPTATKDTNSGLGTSGNPVPHRTRILFYRQFD